MFNSQSLISGQNNSIDKGLKIIYVGGNRKGIHADFSDFNYEVLHFNLSFSADIWLKYNAISLSQLPLAIICDLELGDASGIDLYLSLTSNELLKRIPFIILSKEYNKMDKIKAFEAGVDDFYPVDVSIEDIHNRILVLNEIKKSIINTSTSIKKVTIKKNHKNIKRVFDICISIALLILFSPILMIAALLIKAESKGPIFYVSKRVGTGYSVFDFYKFRTMKNGAEEELSSLIHLNQYIDKSDSSSSFVKIYNDPRVTKVGKLLRKTCLDELPQLLNVIKGDMSLVGNRPLPLYEAEKLTKDLWSKRFLAPVGITGLWQISNNERHFLTAKERIELDVAYAEKASFLYDIKLLINTIPSLIRRLIY